MRQEPIESIEYKDYLINVYQDTDCESPRDSCDFTSHFWNNTRRHTFDSRRESSIENIVDEKGLSKDFIDSHIFVKVYIYSHSGESISTSPFGEPWDSGMFGILAEDKDEIRKEFGVKRISKKLHQKIIDRLEGEVEEVNQWLQGECYGYEITPLGDTKDVLDSCWGFIGDYHDEDSYMLHDYAMPIIDSMVEHDNEVAQKEQEEREHKSCEFWSGTNVA